MSGAALGVIIGGVSANAFSSIVWCATQTLMYAALGILGLIGLRYAEIPNASNYSHLHDHFRKASYGIASNQGAKRYGVFWGWSPVFYIAKWTKITQSMTFDGKGDSEHLTLIATCHTIETLFTKSNSIIGSAVWTHEYTYITIRGIAYAGISSSPSINSSRSIRANLAKWPAQDELVKEIVYCVRKSPNKTCAAVIWGRPGSGKSTVAAMVASELNARICDCDIFCTSEALEGAYNAIEPNANTPIVFRVDEIDSIVDKMLKFERDALAPPPPGTMRMDSGPSRFSAFYPTRREWTALLDRISDGFFPHAVFVFTTNRDVDSYEDKALFRDGRFDIRKQLN